MWMKMMTELGEVSSESKPKISGKSNDPVENGRIVWWYRDSASSGSLVKMRQSLTRHDATRPSGYRAYALRYGTRQILPHKPKDVTVTGSVNQVYEICVHQ